MQKRFVCFLAGLLLAVSAAGGCAPSPGATPVPEIRPPAVENQPPEVPEGTAVSQPEMIRQSLVLRIEEDPAARDADSLAIVYEIRNTGSAPVTFYLDGCGICFWSVSLNGGDYIPQQTAVHVMPCRHRQLRTLPPGEKIRSAGLNLTPLLSSLATQPCRSVRLRYRFGGLMDEDACLESNLLTLPPE